jgi:hypothetical protein
MGSEEEVEVLLCQAQLRLERSEQSQHPYFKEVRQLRMVLEQNQREVREIAGKMGELRESNRQLMATKESLELQLS